MSKAMKRPRADTAVPPTHHAPRTQVAALCCRTGADGGTEVLLITSRETRRWVLPKGWPMADRSAAEAARTEAWEEAGVKAARVWPEPVGSYRYDKRQAGGGTIPVEVQVFRIEVAELCDSYPEAHERTRSWVTPAIAAARVDEPELKALLRGL
ncbi:MAG: NUDIX hydrolase [Roseovarius sp.]